MAEFDTISISSDDSEDPFVENTHKVFVVENKENMFYNDTEQNNLKEEPNGCVSVKPEVLVSFAGIDSIKREPEERSFYDEDAIEILDDSDEVDMTEIEYSLFSAGRDFDGWENSESPQSSAMQLLAKSLAETLGSDAAQTNITDASHGAMVNCPTGDNIYGNVKIKPKSKRLQNLENTIYNVSIGNFSLSYEEINSIRRAKDNLILIKQMNKFLDKKKADEKLVQYLGRASCSAIEHNKHGRVLDRKQEVQNNIESVTENNPSNTSREHKIKKRKYKKSPHQKVKEGINKMKKSLLTTIQEELKEFNLNLNRLKKEYENRRRRKSLALEKSKDYISCSGSSSGNQPLLEKLKLSIDRSSGSISVARIPRVKPLGACKPMQRDSHTLQNKEILVHGPQAMEFSNELEAHNQLENEISCEKSLIQDSSDSLMTLAYDKLLRAKFVECYNLVFDNRGQKICIEMGDLLLVSLKEYRTFISRLEMAKKLSKEQRTSETKCALKSYHSTATRYVNSFETLFKEIHRKICESPVIIKTSQCKNLLLAWFLKVFLRVSGISPELSDSLEEVKHHMLTELLVNVKQHVPMVHETFGTNSIRFQQDCRHALDLMKDVFKESDEPDVEESLTEIPQVVLPTSGNTSETQAANGNVTQSVENTYAQPSNSQDKYGKAHPSESSSNLARNDQYLTSLQALGSLEPSLSTFNSFSNKYSEHIPNMSTSSSVPQQKMSICAGPYRKPNEAVCQKPNLISLEPSRQYHTHAKSTLQSQNVSNTVHNIRKILKMDQPLTQSSTLTTSYVEPQQIVQPFDRTFSSQQSPLAKTLDQNKEASISVCAGQQVSNDIRTLGIFNSSALTICLSTKKVSDQVSPEDVFQTSSHPAESSALVSCNNANNFRSDPHSEAGFNLVSQEICHNIERVDVIESLLANRHPSVTLHYRPNPGEHPAQ